MTCVLKRLPLLLILFFSVTATAQHKGAVRRFALIAASNDGGPSRMPLRYAHKDAKDVARVLNQLGGIDHRDNVLLLEPDRFDFEAGIEKMRSILMREKRAGGSRVELVFYYSGHSDETGLMLGDDLLTYRELRDALSELPADVRIAILDSCSSGALTRGKGGTRRAPFLLDTSVEVEGYAYLTSASEDEAAQESDRIGGSFFTHYLVSGLRGAADHNRDKKVTLQEAYQYAFNETLARTESTQAGPQHPGYDFQLKGSGDLVLTDLRGTSALLVLTGEIEGRIFIRNRQGQLVAEINKPEGNPVSIGLDPGVYELVAEKGRNRLRGTVSLAQGKATTITATELSKMALENTVVRGDTPLSDTLPEAPKPPIHTDTSAREIVNRPFRAGVFPGISMPWRPRTHQRELNRFSVNFIGYGHDLLGFEAGIANIRRYSVEGFQAGALLNIVGGDQRGTQVAGGFNLALGTTRGAQIAGGFNLALGDARGFRGAGMFNFIKGSAAGFLGAGGANIVHGPAMGFEGAGFFNMNTRSAQGFQGAGFVNVNGASAIGFQGAGFVNFNLDTVSGAQMAGFVNISARGASSGFQGAGFTNYVDSLHGAQAAGFVNIAASEIRGAQLAAFNYAKNVKGAQIGVVNITSERMDGAAIGLINYAGNGILTPTFWTSDTAYGNIGIKMGTPNTYGIFGVGTHRLDGEDRYGFIYGLGGHIDLRRLWVELDITSQRLFNRWVWGGPRNDMLYKFRATVGFRVIDQLALYAGPTFNAFMSDEPHDKEWISAIWNGEDKWGRHYRLSFGYVIGIQWEPKFGLHNTHDRDSNPNDDSTK